MMLTAAVFAGGQSRRMGTDKAALEVEGLSLLARIAQAALDAELPAFVVGRACPAGWPLPAVTFAEDKEPRLGPLGGLATALGQNQATAVLALACDLPLLTSGAVRWLGMQRTQSDVHGLIVINGVSWEPLFSLYQPACLPLVEARLAGGKRSLHGLIQAGQFAFASAPDWVAAQLVNVNTPEEWKQTLQQRGR